MEQYSRTQLLLGEDALTRLRRAHVAVFGLGGVGGYVTEGLARSGVGALTLVDHDTISLSNLNRQLLATHSTLGLYKAEAAAQRIRDIDPGIRVTACKFFYGPDTEAEFDFARYDYVVDAIDTVTGKLALIRQAQAAGTPILSCMGTGNKLDPSRFRIDLLSRTSVCPLARIMRKECAKRGLGDVKVLFSTEPPLTPACATEAPPEGRRSLPGSVAYVPSVAGLLIAGQVVRELTGGTSSESTTR